MWQASQKLINAEFLIRHVSRWKKILGKNKMCCTLTYKRGQSTHLSLNRTDALGLCKEGSRMKGTLDFDSFDLGANF
jgi:hypothetical protein